MLQLSLNVGTSMKLLFFFYFKSFGKLLAIRIYSEQQVLIEFFATRPFFMRIYADIQWIISAYTTLFESKYATSFSWKLGWYIYIYFPSVILDCVTLCWSFNQSLCGVKFHLLQKKTFLRAQGKREIRKGQKKKIHTF